MAQQTQSGAVSTEETLADRLPEMWHEDYRRRIDGHYEFRFRATSGALIMVTPLLGRTYPDELWQTYRVMLYNCNIELQSITEGERVATVEEAEQRAVELACEHAATKRSQRKEFTNRVHLLLRSAYGSRYLREAQRWEDDDDYCSMVEFAEANDIRPIPLNAKDAACAAAGEIALSFRDQLDHMEFKRDEDGNAVDAYFVD